MSRFDFEATFDEHVLDAPCGHGRISNRLAARGMTEAGFANATFTARDGQAPSILRPHLV